MVEAEVVGLRRKVPKKFHLIKDLEDMIIMVILFTIQAEGFLFITSISPPTPIDNSGKHKSHLVFYRNRLKDAKASIDANIRYKEQQAKKKK